ncbi:MAG: prephenate/arogenate dehydrogenase family protein [Rhodospirillaceae bacterium]
MTGDKSGAGTPAPLFQRICYVGIGLIGSSLAHVVNRDGLAGETVAVARNQETLDKALALGLVDSVTTDLTEGVAGADLVMICTPVGTYNAIAKTMAPALAEGAIVSDVGSIKRAVIDAVKPHLPDHVSFVPGHPIAGTEKSGPEAGFPELFQGRWCLLTPEAGTDRAAIDKVAALWRSAGMILEEMDPDHHDKVLAITSHLPHLIAYTIVGTASELEDDLQREVIKFSASGFRDFTRIAASDPVMWRDVFLNNTEAVMEILQRFSEDLSTMQRAIRRGDGDTLEEVFTKTRAIRKGVIDAKQA